MLKAKKKSKRTRTFGLFFADNYNIVPTFEPVIFVLRTSY